MNKIDINEIFGPTIQGEGKTAGKECLFVRLAYCNLHCVYCDTPYTWDWKRYTPGLEIHPFTPDQILKKLKSLSKDVKRVIITGGEPLIQQEDLIPLLEILNRDGYIIEIETNGTIIPEQKVYDLTEIFNCSPKLSNSRNKYSLRIKEETLKMFAGKYQEKTIFKFVVSKKKDVEEILKLVELFNLSNVYLMPLGATQKEQIKNQERVKELCKRYGFKFSPRIQVLLHDNKRAI